MSTLLEQASLVMIPSGYKEDVVYSQIPTDGSGDLSFTRASNGTRINSAGLVEVCPWNDLTYSEEFNNAAWSKFDASATANATTAPNGTTTADKFVEGTGSSIHRFNQGAAIVSGQSYTFSVYAKASERTRLLLRTNNGSADQDTYFDLTNGTIVSGTGTIENAGNGWYKLSRSLTATTSVSSNFICQLLLVNTGTNTSYTGDGTSGLFIWGAQLNIGSTAKPYFPTTDRLNVPRLTYQNGGGGGPSLLLEKQSTNLVTYSEDLTQTSWSVAQISVTANATTSPDGTQNADKIAINNGLVGGYIYQIQSTTSSTIYTGSFFVKSAGIGFTKFWSSVSGAYCNAIINLSTGVITNGASPFPTIPTATNFGNGWWRVSYTETSGGGSVPIYVDAGSTSNGGDITGNGTDGIYLWGAQMEASSYPTSYIPTTSSSATRVADACYKTGISSLIGQTQGTMFIDTYVGNETDEVYGWLQASLSGNPNDSIQVNRAGSNIQCQVYVGSTVQGIITGGTITKGQRIKVAVGYKQNDLVLYLNGTQIGVDTSTDIPTCAVFQLGAYPPLPNDYTNDGGINQAVLFTTRLSNSELASLTSL